MNRDELKKAIDNWQSLSPEEQTRIAFGAAFQRAKLDFQQARAAALRSARTSPAGSVTAPNPLA